MLGSAKKAVRRWIVIAAAVVLGIFAYKFCTEFIVLRRIIHNLKAESRIAEVLVVQSSLDEYTRKYRTTVKFLEYDVQGRPLKPKFFTFNGNLIQFQTLVVRFDDKYIEEGHRMKGKSIFLFLKAFVLDGKDTQEFIITPVKSDPAKPGEAPEYTVPEGYRVGNPPNYFEKEIWARFWKYALDPGERKKIGIKNAQVEAPGSVFVPGTIYTLMIEHDGGIRIDTRPIPEILKS